MVAFGTYLDAVSDPLDSLALQCQPPNLKSQNGCLLSMSWVVAFGAYFEAVSDSLDALALQCQALN